MNRYFGVGAVPCAEGAAGVADWFSGAVGVLAANVPPGLAAAVERMMAQSPAERFQSAREVAEALTPFAEGGAGRAALASTVDHRSQPTRPGGARRFRWAGVAAAAIVLVRNHFNGNALDGVNAGGSNIFGPFILQTGDLADPDAPFGNYNP